MHPSNKALKIEAWNKSHLVDFEAYVLPPQNFK